MADLRNYLVIDRTAVTPKNKELVLSIYNTNTASVQNGGQCCCWVVPAGVTWATFELWGAGGDGGGACCCMGHYYGPFTGTYAKKYLQVTPGCYFCICAAGSGCCAQQCCGTCGFPSWVNCQNGTQVTCAAGGCGGCVLCFRSYQGCTGICWGSCNIACYSNSYEFTSPSLNSPNKVSNYCWQNMFEFMQGTPKLGNNTRTGLDHCVTSLTIWGGAAFGNPRWPGGTGNSATACGGGCCYGMFGAGGLVMITYG